MEQKELIHAFNALQGRVEKLVEFDTRTQVRTEMRQIRRKMALSHWTEMILSVLGVLLAGSVFTGNLGDVAASPLLGLPALFVWICCIVMIFLNVRSLSAASEMDYSGSVVAVQKQIAELRKLSVARARWQIVFWLQGWFLLPILALQALAGVEVLARLAEAVPAAWMIGNVVFGLAMIPVIDWMLKRSRYAGSLRDVLVGEEIKDAERFLAEIQAFEAE